MLVYLLAALVLLTSAKTGMAAQDETVQYYNMVSTVEYAGQGQFRNQVEGLFTVREKPLSNDKTQYFISAKDLFKELSFVVDKRAGRLSETPESSTFWAQVNNLCVKSLKKVTKANISKTWKQTFDLSSIGKSLPAELKFTLTAIQVENQKLGKVISVRALSEPFFVRTTNGTARAKINTVYLFDSDIEDIFLSVSVFESTTTMNGFEETLHHKVATCKTDAAGKPVDLKGFGKKFETFVGKLGLTKGLKVTKASNLPDWVKTSGLQAAQAANICSALACEGAMNPVATVSMPTAKVVELQRDSGELRTVNAKLAANEGEGGRPWWDVWGNLVDWVGFWPAAGIVGGSIAIAVNAADDDGSSHDPVSP
jgi:hypothetical protein